MKSNLIYKSLVVVFFLALGQIGFGQNYIAADLAADVLQREVVKWETGVNQPAVTTVGSFKKVSTSSEFYVAVLNDMIKELSLQKDTKAVVDLWNHKLTQTTGKRKQSLTEVLNYAKNLLD